MVVLLYDINDDPNCATCYIYIFPPLHISGASWWRVCHQRDLHRLILQDLKFLGAEVLPAPKFWEISRIWELSENSQEFL